MDIEQKQAEVIDHFVEQASMLKGHALVPLIVEATSNPSLFAFSEILSVPNIQEVYPTLRNAVADYPLFCLFCCYSGFFFSLLSIMSFIAHGSFFSGTEAISGGG